MKEYMSQDELINLLSIDPSKMFIQTDEFIKESDEPRIAFTSSQIDYFKNVIKLINHCGYLESELKGLKKVLQNDMNIPENLINQEGIRICQNIRMINSQSLTVK